MHTYAKPGTPFVFPFHEQLTSNCKIDVHGEVCTPEMRFFVDILSGPHSLLNIEFRFGNERIICLQSCSSDIDSNEIIEVTNPLQAGMKFHLNIVVRLNYYHVRLNGYTVALFPHRYPPSLAQCLAVSKYVRIYSVNVEGFQNMKDDVSTERSASSSGQDLLF
ncbi:hypothetical protein V3C99_017275 [Haemonchus contortus]|nr:Galectin domain containing protein [Haemonchus contortus]